MRSIARRSGLLAITTLLAGAVAWLPQPAEAAGPSLSVTTAGDTTGSGSAPVTFTGTATEPSYLYVYYQPTSAGACPATPQDAQLANTSSFGEGMYTLPAGDFTEQATLSDTQAGQYTICGLLETSSEDDPNQPGPMYRTPVATAQTTVLLMPCLADGFQISHVNVTVSWDEHGQQDFGDVAVTGVTASSGDVVISPAQDGGVAEQAGNLDMSISQDKVTPGQTSDYTFVFYPETQADNDGTCVQPDGTTTTTGPGGDYHSSPVTLAVTWYSAGHGGSGTVNGTVVPGSTPYTPAPSHVPTITGEHNVGDTVDCNVTVPKGDNWNFAWYADGHVVGGGPMRPKYQIPASLHGKQLICRVRDYYTDGFPPVASAPVTVGLGTLTYKHRPRVKGPVVAGGSTYVPYPKMSSPVSTKFAFKWYVGGKPVHTSHGSSMFSIPKKDAGKLAYCVVTVTSKGYKPAKARTKSVKIRK